jgi:hypothetical protein
VGLLYAPILLLILLQKRCRSFFQDFARGENTINEGNSSPWFGQVVFGRETLLGWYLAIRRLAQAEFDFLKQNSTVIRGELHD